MASNKNNRSRAPQERQQKQIISQSARGSVDAHRTFVVKAAVRPVDGMAEFKPWLGSQIPATGVIESGILGAITDATGDEESARKALQDALDGNIAARGVVARAAKAVGYVIVDLDNRRPILVHAHDERAARGVVGSMRNTRFGEWAIVGPNVSESGTRGRRFVESLAFVATSKLGPNARVREGAALVGSSIDGLVGAGSFVHDSTVTGRIEPLCRVARSEVSGAVEGGSELVATSVARDARAGQLNVLSEVRLELGAITRRNVWLAHAVVAQGASVPPNVEDEGIPEHRLAVLASWEYGVCDCSDSIEGCGGRCANAASPRRRLCSSCAAGSHKRAETKAPSREPTASAARHPEDGEFRAVQNRVGAESRAALEALRAALPGDHASDGSDESAGGRFDGEHTVVDAVAHVPGGAVAA